MDRQDVADLVEGLRISVSEAESLDVALHAMLECIVLEVGADRGCVLTDTGHEVRFPGGEEFPYSRRAVDWVLDNQSPIFTLDSPTDSVMSSSVSVKMNDVRVVLCCPVRVLDQPSILYLDSARLRGSLSEKDVGFIQEIFEGLAPTLGGRDWN